MENWISVNMNTLINNIIFYLTDCTYKDSSVIKLNSENLAVCGELYFLYNFKVWKDFVICDKDCTDIFQHYAHTHYVAQGNANTTIEEVNKL